MTAMDKFDRAQWSWILFDLGSFGFCTVTINTYMPIFFKEHHFSHLDPHLVTAYWGYAMSIAMSIGAVAGPLVGAAADYYSARKYLLFVLSIAAGAACLVFPFAVTEIGVHASIACVAVTYLAYLLSTGLYNSMLVSIFTSQARHSASTIATSCGNAGAAVLLTAGYLLVHYESGGTAIEANPTVQHTVLPGSATEVPIPGDTMKLVFSVCCAWWLTFAIPLMLWTPEPQTEEQAVVTAEAEGKSMWARLKEGYQEVAQYKDLWRFIVANVFVNESTGVIFHMSFIFALSIGAVTTSAAVHATIWNRWVSILFGFFWGRMLENQVSPKLCYLIVVSVLAFAQCSVPS